MVLSLALGLGGGYVIGQTQDDNTTSSITVASMDDAEMSDHSHEGMVYNVAADSAPELEIVVVEDAKSGYNIELKTTNFTFTPGNVNGDNVMNEGHGHIYLDGEKIARVYGKYFHYSGSFEGTKTFSATLNANDHSEYAVDGEVIRASLDITHDSNSADHDAMHSADEAKDDMHMDGDDHSHSM